LFQVLWTAGVVLRSCDSIIPLSKPRGVTLLVRNQCFSNLFSFNNFSGSRLVIFSTNLSKTRWISTNYQRKIKSYHKDVERSKKDVKSCGKVT
jgi:hypothetical protein